jgi:hypothetical protein
VLGSDVVKREEKIRYVVVEACRFEFKRPDVDGSLDYWVERLGRYM